VRLETFIFSAGMSATTVVLSVLPNGHLCLPTFLRLLGCLALALSLTHPLNSTQGEEAAKSNSYFNVTTKEGSWYADPPKAQQSIDRMMELDASDDVFVAIAHDGGLLDVIEWFPKGNMNEWKAKGWKEKGHWGFLSELPVEGGPNAADCYGCLCGGREAGKELKKPYLGVRTWGDLWERNTIIG
jgi:hypothetical protein